MWREGDSPTLLHGTTTMENSEVTLKKKKTNTKTAPVFLPGKFHGQRSLVGCSPRGHKESDMIEQLSMRAHMQFLLPPPYFFLINNLHMYVRQEHWGGLPFPPTGYVVYKYNKLGKH